MKGEKMSGYAHFSPYPPPLPQILKQIPPKPANVEPFSNPSRFCTGSVPVPGDAFLLDSLAETANLYLKHGVY